MKIVIVGGTGLVGRKLVALLREHEHDVTPASPTSGVDTVTGTGLAAAIAGAAVVVDVSNPPSFEEAVATEFFSASTRNLLMSEAAAGVRHLVALSVVGTDRLAASRSADNPGSSRGYFRAKLVQETLIKESSIPYSIVRATQFFEFMEAIADAATTKGIVNVAPVLIQPMSAADVAEAVARVAIAFAS